MVNLTVLQGFILAHTVGLGVTAGAGLAGFILPWAAGKYGPPALGAYIREGFLKARASGFLTDKAHPERLRLYLSLLEFVEVEVPDKGDASADAYFLAAATYLCSHLPKWLPLKAEKIAPVLRSLSDEADDDFDAELKLVRELSQSQAGPIAPA